MAQKCRGSPGGRKHIAQGPLKVRTEIPCSNWCKERETPRNGGFPLTCKRGRQEPAPAGAPESAYEADEDGYAEPEAEAEVEAEEAGSSTDVRVAPLGVKHHAPNESEVRFLVVG